MKYKPSKLAHLVIAYHEKFGRHAPGAALRQVDAGDLAGMLEHAIAAGEPLSDTEWSQVLPMEFAPGGCMLRDKKS